MKQAAARTLENGPLKVMDSSTGKFIIFAPLKLGAVVTWRALHKLQKRAKQKVFEWSIDDGSLSVQGKEDQWALAFKMDKPPYSVVTLMLSPTETETVKEYLFAH